MNYKGDSYGLSYSNRNQTNKKFSNSGFDVEIELEGPKINTQNLQRLIEQTQTSSDLISSVTDLLINALNDLNDESNAWISRYFFTDFTLYGCGGIIWNIDKEHKLSSINGNYLDAIRIGKLADEHLTKGSMQVILDDYMSKDGLSKIEGSKIFMSILAFMWNGNEENKKKLNEYVAQFDAIKPEWQKLKAEAQNLLPKLKMQYYNCSNLNCNVNGPCCTNTDYTSDLNQLYDKYNSLSARANAIFRTMANDLITRATEQENAQKVKFIIISVPLK